MKLLLASACIVASAASVFAGGHVTLNGTLSSKDPKTATIHTNSNAYVIDRVYLTQAMNQTIDARGTQGKRLEWTIPMEAVKFVKAKSNR